MKGFENKELVNIIIERLSKLTRRPKDYSITKLVCCPRKTFYKFTGVKELRTDEFELILARGRGHHGVLEVFENKEVAFKKISNCGIPIYGDVDMVWKHPVEIYTTNISSGRVPDGDIEAAAKVFPLKYNQLKACCYMSEYKEGDLLAFFLMGDYKRFEVDMFGKKTYIGIKPKLRSFHYNFEQVELEEIWKKMNVNLEDIEQGKKTGMPPLSAGEEFECEYCGFSYTCLSEEPKPEKDRSGVD